MADIYSLLKQFNAISGIAETGQPGFCLLMALWQKANELNWAKQFTMTNTELLYKAGFNSESTLTRHRNKLKQLGYFDYIKPKNRRQCGTYIMNFNLLNLLNDGSNDGRVDGSPDNRDDGKPDGRVDGSPDNINNKPTKPNKHNNNVFTSITKKFENNGFGNLNIDTQQMLADLTELYSEEWVNEAFDIAIKMNARNIKYVETILINWHSKGKNTDTKKPKQNDNPYAGFDIEYD